MTDDYPLSWEVIEDVYGLPRGTMGRVGGEKAAIIASTPRHLPYCFTELGGSCNCGARRESVEER